MSEKDKDLFPEENENLLKDEQVKMETDPDELVSHYEEDEEGVVKRMLVKRKDVEDLERGVDRTKFDDSGTIRNQFVDEGKGKGHYESEITVENQKYPNNIERGSATQSQNDFLNRSIDQS